MMCSLRLLLLSVVLMTGAASAAPSNPLRLLTHTEWPKTVANVGTAARWMLTPIGYRLANDPTVAPDTLSILARPISPAGLKPQTLPIEEALLAVAGPDTVVYVDHVKKLIAFGYVARKQ